jgi:ribosomal protein S18 acetylase RimI-like enzyme
MLQVQVRQAKEQDLEAVLELWQEMMNYHAQLDERLTPLPDAGDHFRQTLRGWMAQRERRVLVAVADHEIVGYAIGAILENSPIYALPRSGHVSDICVAPAWRRRGLGHRLFAGLRTWFRQRGVQTVQLHVASRNPAARAFWQDIGFVTVLERMTLDI